MLPVSVETGGMTADLLEALAVEGAPGADRVTVVVSESVIAGAAPVTPRAGPIASQANVTLAVR